MNPTGWRNTKTGVHLQIGRLPGRKSPCLYVERGGQIEALAYFASDDAAQRASEALNDLLLGARGIAGRRRE